MQSSMVEMEHLYDGIRSVKHDMKNNMAVLQSLIRKKYSGEDEEIQQYFEDMYQSVEQLDNRVNWKHIRALRSRMALVPFRWEQGEISKT